MTTLITLVLFFFLARALVISDTQEDVMENMLSIFLNIGTLGIYYLVEYKVHVEMTEETTDKCIKASYEDFMHEFNRTNWEFDNSWTDSLFGKGELYNENEFHASIIKMKNRGYVMKTSGGYFLAERLKRKKIREIKYGN